MFYFIRNLDIIRPLVSGFIMGEKLFCELFVTDWNSLYYIATST